jgi:hypothetical protein
MIRLVAGIMIRVRCNQKGHSHCRRIARICHSQNINHLGPMNKTRQQRDEAGFRCAACRPASHHSRCSPTREYTINSSLAVLLESFCQYSRLHNTVAVADEYISGASIMSYSIRDILRLQRSPYSCNHDPKSRRGIEGGCYPTKLVLLVDIWHAGPLPL